MKYKTGVIMFLLSLSLLLPTGCGSFEFSEESGVENGPDTHSTESLDIKSTPGPAPQQITPPPGTPVPRISVFAAGFRGADGIAIDAAGNMYVGNRRTNEISIVDQQGNVRMFVTLDCEELLCMTADEENNLYAAGMDKVFKVEPDGTASVLADGFSCADDLRLDPVGNIYITDSREDRVYKLSSDLQKSVFIESDKEQAELGNGWHITGITFDKEYRYLYIAKMKEGRVLRYPILHDGSAGSPETVIEGIREPDHLEMDDRGRLYVTLFRTGSLIRIDPSGSVETLCDGDMKYATGIVLGRSGFDENSAYVADYGRDVVYRIRID